MKSSPTTTLGLLASSLLLPLAGNAAQLKGLWEFEDTANLGKATVGSALTLNGTITATAGVSGSDDAIDVATGVANYLSVTNPIPANGASGTPARTNQFTVVLDFMVPDFDDGGADNGNYTGLFDFDNGGSDADYFVRKQANLPELGVSTVWNYLGAGATTANNGAAGSVRESTWYRLAVTANNGVANESSVYLNGTKLGNHANGTIDAVRRSLSTTTAFRVLWDNDAVENSRTLVSNLALYDGRMTDAEVLALGVAGTPIVPSSNQAPVVTVQAAGTSPVAPNNAANYSFAATDAEGDQVQFEINWGDGQTDAWSPLQAVASPYQIGHAYTFPGSYQIQARVRDSGGNTSNFAGIQTISVAGKQLTWTGGHSSEWSAGTLVAPKNWVLTADGTTTADFAPGDDVVFGNNPASTTVAINGADVSPFTLLFDHESSDYTLTGTNGIAGPIGMTKSGAGTLTLANPNPLQGITSITGGDVVINNSLALSNSVIETTYPDGNLAFGTVTEATLGGLGGNGDIELESLASQPVVLTFGKNATTSVHTGELSGTGALIKVGTGTQALNFPNAFTGGTTLNAGTLRIGDAEALGTGPVVQAGGSLTFSISGAVTVANDITLAPAAYQTFIIRGGNDTAPAAGTSVTLSGKLSGGTAGLNYRLVDSNTGSNHNNTLALTNPANDFAGNIELWRGFLAFTSDAALGNADNDLRVDCNNGNGGLRFDADGITLSATRTITLVTTNSQEGFIVPSGKGTIAGPIVGVGAMVKRGDGELVLSSSTNSFTGNIAVAAGKLTIDGTIATSANAVTVNAGTTLGGSGTINRAVTANGTVAPGSGAGTLSTGAVTLNGTLAVEVDGAAADKLAVTGNLVLGAASSVALDLLPGGFSQPSYVIAEWTGTLSGTFATVPAGYQVTYTASQAILAPATASGFETWAASKGVTGFDNDSDGDGIPNGIEFVIGGEPAPGAGSNSAALLPTASRSGTGELVIVFRRSAESAYLNPGVESSTTLTGTWNPGPAGTVIGTDGSVDLVEVRLPSSLAAGGKIFARLAVSE